jgi:hypothetical protein
MVFSTRCFSAAASFSIFCIVFWRTEIEMIWIDAARKIAVVQDVSVARIAFVQPIRFPVCMERTALVSHEYAISC